MGKCSRAEVELKYLEYLMLIDITNSFDINSKEAMKSWIVRRVLLSSSLSASLSGVNGPPGHRLDNLNFVSCTYVHICSWFFTWDIGLIWMVVFPAFMVNHIVNISCRMTLVLCAREKNQVLMTYIHKFMDIFQFPIRTSQFIHVCFSFMCLFVLIFYIDLIWYLNIYVIFICQNAKWGRVSTNSFVLLHFSEGF